MPGDLRATSAAHRAATTVSRASRIVALAARPCTIGMMIRRLPRALRGGRRSRPAGPDLAAAVRRHRTRRHRTRRAGRGPGRLGRPHGQRGHAEPDDRQQDPHRQPAQGSPPGDQVGDPGQQPGAGRAGVPEGDHRTEPVGADDVGRRRRRLIQGTSMKAPMPMVSSHVASVARPVPQRSAGADAGGGGIGRGRIAGWGRDLMSGARRASAKAARRRQAALCWPAPATS